MFPKKHRQTPAPLDKGDPSSTSRIRTWLKKSSTANMSTSLAQILTFLVLIASAIFAAINVLGDLIPDNYRFDGYHSETTAHNEKIDAPNLDLKNTLALAAYYRDSKMFSDSLTNLKTAYQLVDVDNVRLRSKTRAAMFSCAWYDGRYEEALDHLDKAIELDCTNPDLRKLDALKFFIKKTPQGSTEIALHQKAVKLAHKIKQARGRK